MSTVTAFSLRSKGVAVDGSEGGVAEPFTRRAFRSQRETVG
jgi:hypothetical protein